MYTLISATPSPYARKVRIALQEKGIPFTLKTEVPWDSTTTTPTYNPLEKLPILMSDDGRYNVYESHFIMEWLEAKHPEHPLLSPIEDIDNRLLAKQIEVVADGMCDALVLALFEKKREPEKQSKPWADRQMRKVAGGLKALERWSSEKKSDWLVGNQFGLADIALGAVCGYLSVRWPDYEWKSEYPALCKHWQTLESRQSFKDTVPTPQTMKDQIV